MYTEAGQLWYQAMSNYDLAKQAFIRGANKEGLSYLGEAIVRLERAVTLGEETFPPTILAQAKQSIDEWYLLFIELVEQEMI